MSRLTASPFHKPSPSEFLPSPPETLSDSLPHMLPHNLAAHDSGVFDAGLSSASPDTSSRAKRSSIPYHSSTFREAKDRGIQRAGKSLIIVVPPSTLIQEHGHHGHTLSNGPYHRLSQGVVMPLFPSLFGQLTAIAREFNFPSTSGLCLYLHYIEDGFTLTPRISDDSWQALWGHLSDTPRPNEHRPFISGKVEFDIDIRLARWYTSWLSAMHREISDNRTHSYPATAPSFRREGSLPDTRNYEEDLGENAAVHQRSAPISRHVPRKLSLVDRFDISTARPETKIIQRSVIPPDVPTSNSHTLSTIVQEEEPQTARRSLDHRVNSWRANAVVSPVGLTATGHTSLEATDPPNDMSIDTPVEPVASPMGEEMRLGDYAWSMSSIGPQSPFGVSTSSWSPLPSIHLANRLEGSVLLTPSTCTSFGPISDDYLSLISEPFSRLPSPDLAHRFYEDCPPTPMTATSWGVPLSYPPSPRCISPVPSLDIGERVMFTTEPSISALGGPKGGPKEHTSELRNRLSEIPQFSLPSQKPWSHIWPYTVQHDEFEPSRTPSHQSLSLPSLVQPTSDIHQRHLIVSDRSRQSFSYPYINIYRSVYPYLEMYPTVPGIMEQSMTRNPPRKPNVQVRLSPVYPTFDLYPAVYPYNLNVIYPSTLRIIVNSIGSQEGYPYFNIYPPIRSPFFAYLSIHLCMQPSLYPDLGIYPEKYVSKDQEQEDQEQESKVLSPAMHLQHYPVFNLYPALYPNFDLYPPVVLKSQVDTSGQHGQSQWTTLGTTYPRFNIYPAVYPYFDIYPAVYVGRTARRKIPPQRGTGSLSVTLPPTYPCFDLYPSVYPYFRIYPARYDGASVEEENVRPLESALFSGYPFFNIYPGVYPHLDIYPAPCFSSLPEVFDITPPKSNGPDSHYPFFNLYPVTTINRNPPTPQSLVVTPRLVQKSRSSSRLTHAELHAVVMMETRHREPIQAFQEKSIIRGTQTLGIDRKEDILHHVRRSSASSSSKHDHSYPSTSTGDPRQLSLSHMSNVRMSPKVPSKPDILRSSSLKEQVHFRSLIERDVPGSSVSRVAIPKSSYSSSMKQAPGRRDSLVLQRVKAFDHEGEVSTGLSKETLAKFPMPPGAPKGFPPLPPLPVNRSN